MKPVFSRQEHERVLKNAIDVPEQKPSFDLDLSAVGISGKTVWVKFADSHLGRLPFKAEILVDLPATTRGIHMSRIEQTITDLYDRTFVDLRDYALALGSRIIAGQHARTGLVSLHGQTPLLRRTPVTDKLSIDTVELTASVRFGDQDGERPPEAMIGVSCHHLTACPCTLAYNQVLFDQAGSPCLPATHSQRSLTRLQVQTDFSVSVPAPSYEDLIDCLTSALHPAQDLLKRPDEAELVFRAHRNPQFAEDAVRETARAVASKLGTTLPSATRIVIDSLSLESIHIHDVKCRLETSLGEILKVSRRMVTEL